MDVRAVFSAHLSPQWVWGFVERLVDEPWSRYRAKARGGDQWREHLGWGTPEYLTAALIDAVQSNTSVTAAHGSGKKPRKPKPFYRPSSKPTEAFQPADLASLPLAEIEQMIND